MAKKSKKANAVKRATSTTNNNKSTAATAHADATDFEQQLDKHLADFEKLVSHKEPASAQTQARPESSKAATAPATTDGIIPSTAKKKKKKKKKSKKGSEIVLPKTSNPDGGNDDVDFESATATATEPDDVSDGENPDESNGMDMKDPFGVAPSGEHSPPKTFGGHAASPEVARAKSTPPPSPPPTRKLPMTPAEHPSFEESSRADVVDDDVAAAESALSATDVLAKAVESLPDQTDSKEGKHDGAKAEADAEHGDKPSPLPSKLPIHTSRLSSESVPEILGSLRLTVISAENVPKKVLGKRDTFVICLVNGQEKLRTAVCKKSEKPVWSGATARCVVDDVHPSATLRFQLWEHDSTTTNNLIGDVTFDSAEAIADLPDADTVHDVLVRRRRTKGTKPIRMKLRIHYVTPAERRQSLLRRESSRSLSLHELSPPTEKLPAPPIAQMKTEQPASQRKSNPERRPAAKQTQVTEEQNSEGRSSATKPSIEVPPRGGAVDESVVLPSLGQSPGGTPTEEGNAEEDPTVMWRKRLAELTTVAPTANSSSTVLDVNGRFGDAVAEETPSVRPSSQLLSNLTSQLHDITSDFDALEAHAELDLDDSLSESARNVYINAPPRKGPITPVLSSPRYQTSGYEKLHQLEPQPAVLSPRDKRLEKPRFKVLESVNGLDLTGMGIRTLQKVALSTSLLSLKASSNLLGKIEFLPKSLTELDLSNNKITTITGLQEVRNLKVLSLCGNSISRLHGLKNNLKLEELFIANNVVKEVKYLEPLKELKILDLENNLLEGISSCALLSRNHKLEHLCVEGNPLAEIPEYRFELKKILPRAKWIDGKRVEVKRSKSPTPTSESVHHPKPWGWSTDQTKEATERLRAAKRRSQSPDKFAEMQWMRNRASPPDAPWSPSVAERLIMEQARKDAIVAQQHNHQQQQEKQRRSVVVRGDVTSPLRTAKLISQSPTKSPTSPAAKSTDSRKHADVPTAFASPARSPDSSVVAVSLRPSHASIWGNHTVVSPTSPPAVSTASPPLSASTRTSASVVTVSPATTAASHSASSPSTRRGIASRGSPAKGLQDSSFSSRNRAAKSPPQRQISHGPKPKVVSIDLSPSYTTHGVKGVVTRQRTSGGSSGWFGAAEVSLSDGREGYDDASLSIASISEIPESMSLELSHTENPTQSVNQPQVLSLSEALSLKDAMMQGQNGGGQRHNHHAVEEDSGSETQVTFSESERDETEESALDTIRRELDDHDNSQFLRDEAGSSSAAGDGAVNGSGSGEKGKDKQLANIAKKFEDDLILELSQRRLEDRLAAVLEKAAGNFPPSPAGAQTRHGDRNYDDKAHAMSKLKRDLERVKGRIQSNTS